jgi:hypothetical protein
VQADAVTLANTTGLFEKLATRDEVYKRLSAQGVLGKSGTSSDFVRNFAAPDVGALSELLLRKGATDGGACVDALRRACGRLGLLPTWWRALVDGPAANFRHLLPRGAYRRRIRLARCQRLRGRPARV